MIWRQWSPAVQTIILSGLRWFRVKIGLSCCLARCTLTKWIRRPRLIQKSCEVYKHGWLVHREQFLRFPKHLYQFIYFLIFCWYTEIPLLKTPSGMAVKWMLLTMLPMAFCSPSIMIEPDPITPFRICGSRMADILENICKDYGGIAKRAELRMDMTGKVYSRC